MAVLDVSSADYIERMLELLDSDDEEDVATGQAMWAAAESRKDQLVAFVNRSADYIRAVVMPRIETRRAAAKVRLEAARAYAREQELSALRLERDCQRRLDRLVAALDELNPGKKEHQLDTCTLRRCKKPQGVKGLLGSKLNIGDIPEEVRETYTITREVTKTERVINTDKLREDLGAGLALPWAQLSDSTYIKFK